MESKNAPGRPYQGTTHTAQSVHFVENQVQLDQDDHYEQYKKHDSQPTQHPLGDVSDSSIWRLAELHQQGQPPEKHLYPTNLHQLDLR